MESNLKITPAELIAKYTEKSKKDKHLTTYKDWKEWFGINLSNA